MAFRQQTFWSRPSSPKLAIAWDIGVENYGPIERMTVDGYGYTFIPLAGRNGNCFIGHWKMNPAIKERKGDRQPEGQWEDARRFFGGPQPTSHGATSCPAMSRDREGALARPSALAPCRQPLAYARGSAELDGK